MNLVLTINIFVLTTKKKSFSRENVRFYEIVFRFHEKVFRFHEKVFRFLENENNNARH